VISRAPHIAIALILSSTVFGAVPQMREGFVQIPGARIFYIDSGGNGTPVVFLHATTGSARVWEHQIPAITAAGYRFIAYDRRGWGRTEVDPAGPQPGTGADDLKCLIEALKIGRFHLVGTAAGAIVAIDYRLSFPEQVRSLVLANTIGGVVDEEYLNLGRKIRPPQFDALPPEFKELGPAYRASNQQGVDRWMEFERASRRAGAAAAAQTMRNRITLSLLGTTIHLPTLLIAGGSDLYSPPPIMQLFANKIRGSRMATIPNAGHSSWWEAPELFNRALLRFLREH
jgi:pimeloyl-ACP methyl ester carboxylesterase